MFRISREDIPSDRIVDYPVADRFIKLPIRKYLDLINIEPIVSQTALINAVNNPKYRFITAALSRRQGKTFIANIIGQLVSLVPGCNILIMSPNYSLSQISFELQRSLLKQFSIEVVKDNAKDKVIELSNKSTIRMGSINQVDSCVGRSYDLIIFDEAALSKDGEDAFNIALRPTLDKAGSKAIFISTPRGKNNWFARFFDRGFSDDYPQWISIHADYTVNPRVSEADIAEAKKTMSEAYFSQEYLASFNVFEGQIWKFDKEKCIVNGFDPLGCEIIAGLDMGFRDPTAFIVLAYDWDSECYYALDEYLYASQTTSIHAEKIMSMMEKYDIDYIFIDSAAAQTRHDLANDYDIPTINAKKSIVDGIGFVSSLIDNNRLFVDESCKHLLAALDQYQWDPNPNLITEKPLHNNYCHMADALRYALYSHTVSCGVF